MTTQLLWDKPPFRKPVTAVDAGAVVLVRINPTSSDAILAQDASGVPPHLVFTANLASRGTTGMVAFDPFGNVAEVGERPTTGITLPLAIDNGKNEFLLDLGRAFLAPFAGNISIEGGAFTENDGGAMPQAAYEINVQTVMPQYVALGMPFSPLEVGVEAIESQDTIQSSALAIDRRSVERQTGEWFRRRPTMTYFKVGTTHVPIPRGAVDVTVNVTQNVRFHLGGNGGGHATGTLTLSVPAGFPMPLGFLSQGTFSSAGTIDWISFGIEVG